MNRGINIRLLLIVASSPVVTSFSFGQSHAPIVPSKPAELIKYLPEPPAGWKMTESTAKNFFLGWICSQATREFQHPSPLQPGTPPGPPFVTRVRLMDTGYFASFNGDFENFRIG